MTTTLNKIREKSPCKAGWEKLLKNLGKTKADDEELDLLAILDSNGLSDTVWCFRAVDGYDTEMRAFARFCAMQNIERIKPYCSEEDYSLIIEWLENGDEGLMSTAESATRSAAWSAAESATHSAAWSAAHSAAWSAAESADSAAWSAAHSAAWSAAESAARSAAESAAWSVESAHSAARSAAHSAARSAQEAELRRIL